MSKTILIGIDRDGTINKDENYHLGRDDDWESQIEFLPGVIDGLKLLNTLPDARLFMITNQGGVAHRYFTETTMHQVCQKMMDLLEDEGAKLHGYFACPFVDYAIAKKAKQKGQPMDLAYVDEDPQDRKPNIGMLEKAASKIGYELNDMQVFMIGDRYVDVKLGLNAKGTGVLVASSKTLELGDVAKVQCIQENHPGRVYIASDFLDAAKYIENAVKK